MNEHSRCAVEKTQHSRPHCFTCCQTTPTHTSTRTMPQGRLPSLVTYSSHVHHKQLPSVTSAFLRHTGDERYIVVVNTHSPTDRPTHPPDCYRDVIYLSILGVFKTMLLWRRERSVRLSRSTDGSFLIRDGVAIQTLAGGATNTQHVVCAPMRQSEERPRRWVQQDMMKQAEGSPNDPKKQPSEASSANHQNRFYTGKADRFTSLVSAAGHSK